MTRLVGVLALAACAASCQVYDFERVEPLALAQTRQRTIVASRRLKPNVMLLVDNSSSMKTAIDGANPSGPTRVSELKSAMSMFLGGFGTNARLGVTVFPTNEICAGASAVDVELPAPTANDLGTEGTLAATAQRVDARIQALVPAGGTPTGASLAFLAGYPGLLDGADQREDFVVLLTDGLPNCDEHNPNQACGGASASCRCTLGTSPEACTGASCALGCLDRDGAVARVRELRQKGVRTVVVGFGAELGAGDGPDVLNAMAEEGGLPRQCPNGTDDECGTGDTCVAATRQCARAFFQAANGAELADALLNIRDAVICDFPCTFQLADRPSDPSHLAVLVDEVSQVAGPQTFSYDSARNEVAFLGETCDRLKTSTPATPVTVEFRIVEAL